MRFLIVSDIHANLQALAAVIEDAEGRYDRVACCGDLVGYGADPNAVTDWVRSAAIAVVRGNHDKAAAGLDDIEWFNPFARAATLYTRQALTPGNAHYLTSLPLGPLDVAGFQIAHGSPGDEDEYLVSAEEVRYAVPHLVCAATFIGHTHIQGAFHCHRNGVRRIVQRRFRRKWELELEPDQYYLLNPGSVGQPRDGDSRAGYAIYSPDERLAVFHRVEYDIGEAQKRILLAGLPPILADRLAVGT